MIINTKALRESRKDAKLNQTEIGKSLGRSTQTIVAYEHNPELMRLGDLGKWQQAVGERGMHSFRQFVDDFFSP